MIDRISNLPFFGPEEQIRKFINQPEDPLSEIDYVASEQVTQQAITQSKISRIDELLQKQLIWSYGRNGIDDAYFYWDWCPSGTDIDKIWKIETWYESQDVLNRDIDRNFFYKRFKGYTNKKSRDIPIPYEGEDDEHASEDTNIDIPELMHNIMRSYIEVSEWLGDGSTRYGSHNGFVSRKMSLCWLFDAVRALINFKLNNQDGFAQKDISPLSQNERFGSSACQIDYNDNQDLDQVSGRCGVQQKQRANKPDKDGVLKVRGNEFHYGERADFYTHNSFIGECRFFHNTRFLGQATFDKEINGTCLRTRWADLAEYKESDKAYEPGTLVMFGGAKEITLSNGVETHAIVTSKPGLVLNSDKQEGKIMVGIALVGTVPVRIVGSVRKFDKLVPSKKVLGAARARKWYEFWKKPIGIAMNASVDELVDCVTRLTF